MEWQYLKGFYTIAKLGSVTRAAEALFRTQSALSQQVSKLEQSLDCTLFQRVGKNSLQLTSEGKEVFAFAEKIFLQERSLTEKLKALSQSYKGYIYLAAPYAVHQYMLSHMLSSFTQLYPDILLHVFDYTPHRCIESVQRGQADFCIVHESSVPSSMHTIPWLCGQYMVIVPKGHELERLERIELEDLVKYPLNLPRPNVKASARDKLDRACEAAGLSFHTIVESPNAAINITYAARGLGIAVQLCYEYTITHFKDRANFLPLSHIFPDENLVIATRKESDVCTHKDEFIRFLFEDGIAVLNKNAGKI